MTFDDLRVVRVRFPSAQAQEATFKKLLEQSIPLRVRTIELDGPTVRHHNNTLRAWESIPVRVTVD